MQLVVCTRGPEHDLEVYTQEFSFYSSTVYLLAMPSCTYSPSDDRARSSVLALEAVVPVAVCVAVCEQWPRCC